MLHEVIVSENCNTSLLLLQPVSIEVKVQSSSPDAGEQVVMPNMVFATCLAMFEDI